MDVKRANNPADIKDGTRTERTSDRELVVTRTFDGPVHLVFKAWTTPELLMRWWAPESFGINLIGCEADARTGGRYRFVFDVPGQPEPFAFFGKYLEVTPPKRLVWTNEETDDGSAPLSPSRKRTARPTSCSTTSIPARTPSTPPSRRKAQAAGPSSSTSSTWCWPARNNH